MLMKRFGLVGLAAGTLIAQSLTAYWFVPYRGLRRLRMGLRQYLGSVLVPCAAVFVIALGLSLLSITIMDSPGHFVRLATVCLISGLVLAAATWLLVMDSHQRYRTSTWLGLHGMFGSPASK